MKLTQADIKQDWSRLRSEAYPPMADFADAFVKGDEAAMEKYRQDCLAVKDAIPKIGGTDSVGPA